MQDSCGSSTRRYRVTVLTSSPLQSQLFTQLNDPYMPWGNLETLPIADTLRLRGGQTTIDARCNIRNLIAVAQLRGAAAARSLVRIHSRGRIVVLSKSFYSAISKCEQVHEI